MKTQFKIDSFEPSKNTIQIIVRFSAEVVLLNILVFYDDEKY